MAGVEAMRLKFWLLAPGAIALAAGILIAFRAQPQRLDYLGLLGLGWFAGSSLTYAAIVLWGSRAGARAT